MEVVLGSGRAQGSGAEALCTAASEPGLKEEAKKVPARGAQSRN